MLASMVLWRSDDGFVLQVPHSVAAPFMKRLSMFVLRSKVRIADLSASTVSVGVGGPKAQERLEAAGIGSPAADFDVVRAPAGDAAHGPLVVRLPGGRHQLIYTDVEAAMRDWRLISASATVTSVAPWRWLGVRSGIPEIEAETQDKYVPQMINFELVGGVSFTKGCYPGQEIVARTQYRGEIKRRMFLAHTAQGPAPTRGQDVVAQAEAAQAVGSVVDWAEAPAGGYDVLVCVHLDRARDVCLHLGTGDGPELSLQPLPYSLPQAL
jgi:folate-binding protein YgfZ